MYIYNKFFEDDDLIYTHKAHLMENNIRTYIKKS